MIKVDLSQLRFLVVEDNAHMRRVVRTLIHSFGAREVAEAEDGATGLELFQTTSPDIVIADWYMPIFSGIELTRMMRNPESSANPTVPIIMLTGALGKTKSHGSTRRRRNRIPLQTDLRECTICQSRKLCSQPAQFH